MSQNHKKNLLSIFQAALESVSGHSVVEKELSDNHHEHPEQFHVIAIGKAADAMLQGVPSGKILSGLLISKHGHISEKSFSDNQIICVESDHPLPKENSIKAGQTLLSYLEKLPDNEPAVFLISGGTSALVEVLQTDWDLHQLQELTDYLLANAYPINEINAIRRRLSLIKGGGLWSFLNSRPVTCLMISDVPDDDPAIIGSGMLFSNKEHEDDESSLELSELNLPQHWLDKLGATPSVTIPKSFKWKIIASLDQAKQAASKKAQSLGYDTEIVPEFLDSEASIAAVNCVDTIITTPNKLFIWGGETTVHLPKNAGRGGRNQHLALAAAIQIREKSTGSETYLLSAGTDGTDGLTDATGAIVNQTTVDDIITASDYLLKADSNSYFSQHSGLIETGATGTNVMDLVLGITT